MKRKQILFLIVLQIAKKIGEKIMFRSCWIAQETKCISRIYFPTPKGKKILPF